MWLALECGHIAAGHGASAREVAYRGLSVPLARAEGVVGDSVGRPGSGVGADTGPADEVLELAGVQRVTSLGIVDQVQHGFRVPFGGKEQPRSFPQGSTTEGVLYGLGYVLVRERIAAGVPAADGGVQRRKVGLREYGTGQLHQREQLRVRRVRQQPGGRLPTHVSGADAQVEQGRAASDVQGAVGGVGMGHGPLGVRPDVEGAGAAQVAELPRLSVVHGRCGCGVADESSHGFRVERLC
ncbi:hypothetical protein GCM10017771_18730 [Streptomyces capitiformicae]|uniref:Uncharacterized protein n=1 Tax=Streptomyces capitiformicae TaxID=2014920 RepID=A0A919GIU2_9ACTN|nr:hypothetical protein GCM10017771_18730 [Streptomyces capitiformicae]